MKFTLVQLIACVALILLIAFILLNLPKNTSETPQEQPAPTIPFMEIQMK